MKLSKSRTEAGRRLCFLTALAVSLYQPRQLLGQTGSSSGTNAAVAGSPTEAQIQDRVRSLLEQMTLEEKVAQLSQLPNTPQPEFDEVIAKSPEEVIKEVGAGSVLWASEPKEINRLQHIAVDQSRLHIPILFGLDVIHGYHAICPVPVAMASAWDVKMVEDAQTVATREVRAEVDSSLDFRANGGLPRDAR